MERGACGSCIHSRQVTEEDVLDKRSMIAGQAEKTTGIPGASELARILLDLYDKYGFPSDGQVMCGYGEPRNDNSSAQQDRMMRMDNPCTAYTDNGHYAFEQQDQSATMSLLCIPSIHVEL